MAEHESMAAADNEALACLHRRWHALAERLATEVLPAQHECEMSVASALEELADEASFAHEELESATKRILTGLRSALEQQRILDDESAARAAKQRETETYAHIGRALLHDEQAPSASAQVEAMITDVEGEGSVHEDDLDEDDLDKDDLDEDNEIHAVDGDARGADDALPLPVYELDERSQHLRHLSVWLPPLRTARHIHFDVLDGLVRITAPGYAELRLPLPSHVSDASLRVIHDFDSEASCFEVSWPVVLAARVSV